MATPNTTMFTRVTTRFANVIAILANETSNGDDRERETVKQTRVQEGNMWTRTRPSGRVRATTVLLFSLLALTRMAAPQSLGIHPAIATAASSGTFTRTGSLITARSEHTATLLPNGKVLITGGLESTTLDAPSSILASAELYDPGTGTFSPAGNMTAARSMHASTTLADGRVLIVGGYGYGAGTATGAATALATAELYDPSTGSFTPTRNMATARGWPTAILLASGNVLVVGGGTAAELYDPDSGMFSATGPYVGHGACDFCAPSTLLADGTVLFPGQYPTQIYDPVTNWFKVAGMMISDHSTAALLPNGQVLFAGGEDLGRSSSAELYDPTIGTFTPTGSMMSQRVWHTLTLLPDGTVLTTGGETDGCAGSMCSFVGGVASAELYDSSKGIFLDAGSMTTARETHTATLLNDGRVLIAGGVSYGGIGIFSGSLLTAELYTPGTLAPAPTLISLTGDGHGQGEVPLKPFVSGEDD